MVITLIGYRGCGKSSVAPLLASQLGWQSVDSDDVIEEHAGCSIQQIFADEGEGGFRDREAAVIAALTGQTDLVLAAGGGAILRKENRLAMRQAGPVVWLQVDATDLAERISRDASTTARRPSLTGKTVTDEVAEVLAVREPIYRSTATLIVRGNSGSPAEIAKDIMLQITGSSAGEQSS